MKMLLLVTSLLGISLSSASALLETQFRPIVIENSRSPDGSQEITITANPGDDDGGAGLVQVRQVVTGACLGSFTWADGCVDQVSERSFRVTWRPDSRAFAISYQATRHYDGCEIYVLRSHGRCQRVKVPELSARDVEKYGLREHPRWGMDFIRWLPDDRLEIMMGSAFTDFSDGIFTFHLSADPESPEFFELDLKSVRPDT